MNHFLMLGVGILLFIMGLLIAYKLINVVADLVIIAVALAGFWLIHEALNRGDVTTWGQLIVKTPLLGAVAALLTAPVLPFTSWYGGRRAIAVEKQQKKKT